jgi:hypothetical protein
MINRNPQLSAIALLVRKFGERIAGGGYEVRVTTTEMMEMSPHGTFQEVPDIDQRGVRWQYFPNITIDAEGHVVPDSVTPEGVTAKVENADPQA